ncbi:hypothetical protein QTP88_010488 [Uroleucon formosanum]
MQLCDKTDIGNEQKKCIENKYKPNLENNLAYIKSNFSILSVAIDKLQAKNLSLATSLNIIKDIEETLKTLNGEPYHPIYIKLKNVLEKNSGLSKLKHISNILDGDENTNIGELLGELTCSDIVYFKYAPIVSVDVERSFSTYKTLLADNRRKFKFDNLAKHLIIQCNTQDGKIIYCLVCEKSVSTEKKYLLDHHSKIIQHINALQRNKERKQLFITSQISNSLSIGNLLIGKLDGTPSKSYLVTCKELESTNYETICQFIDSSLKIFPVCHQNQYSSKIAPLKCHLAPAMGKIPKITINSKIRRILLLENSFLRNRLRRNKRKKIGVHEINKKRNKFADFHHIYNNLRIDRNDRFFNFLRMFVETFDFILSKIKLKLTKKITN